MAYMALKLLFFCPRPNEASRTPKSIHTFYQRQFLKRIKSVRLSICPLTQIYSIFGKHTPVRKNEHLAYKFAKDFKTNQIRSKDMTTKQQKLRAP